MDLSQFFRLMAEQRASDLFFSAGAPVYIKIEGEIRPVNKQVFDAALVKKVAYALMTPEQIAAFESSLEMNFGVSVPNTGRFRVNVFRQRGSVAMVIRYITDQVPSVDSMGLPPILKELVMQKRGLILVVGATGSGKSTTLASMIDHRNAHSTSHILAIEDPIEFIHRHKRSIVNQREVGIDTNSYASALVNALREAPDVLLIGEIRDQDTMRQALIYTQTGHLCLATLHANNAYHAMNRVISLFPAEMQEGLLLDLAMSLKAVISQRLVKGKDGKRVAAMEILVNNMHIAELIQRREIDKIKEAIEQSLVEGSQTFEESLLELHLAGRIGKDEALLNSDSRTNMEWLIANSSKYQEQRAQRKREFQIEDKVAEDQDQNFPGLLSVDDLDKLGVAGLTAAK
jgi:twitching motility protein PilU